MARNDLDVRVKLGVESKEYRDALRRANAEAKEFKKQQRDAYKGAAMGASDGFGSIIALAKKMAPAVSAGAAALKTVQTAMRENQSITDEWARITESARASWEGFVDAIVSADFGNYVSNMSEMIRQAREAADAMDTLGTTQLFTNRAMSEYDLKIRQARTIIKDPNSTKEQREAAAQDIQNAQAAQLADAQRLSNDYMVAFASKLAQYVTSKGSKATATDYIEQDANGNWQIKAGSLFEKYYGDLAAYERKSAEYVKEKALRSTVVGTISMGQWGSESVYGKGNLSDEEYAELRAYVELSDEKLKEVFDLFAAARQNLSRVYTSQNENFEYLNRVAKEGGRGGTSDGDQVEYQKGSIGYIEQQISDWGKKMSMETSDAGRAAAQAMIDELKAQKKQMIADANAGAIETLPTTGLNYSLGPVSTMPTDIQGIGGVTKESKKFKLTSDEVEKGMTELNTVFSQTSSIIGALSNKSMKANQVIGTIMSAIGSIIGGPWGAALRGVGSIVGAFDTGGIVGGTSYKGDRLTANVSSGEMILNRQQQRNLFNTLQGGGAPATATTVGVRGEDIYIALSNYMRRTNKRI